MCLTEYNEAETMEMFKKEGIKEGIKALILDNLEDGKTEDVIIGKLVKRFQLEKAAAKEYFDQFSKAVI